jgi:hypothetical protein
MMDAWSIVDAAHVARQMVRKITDDKTRGQLCSEYLVNFETATFMRNHMDHMDDAIGNRVASKSIRTALFGAVSYLMPRLERRNEHMAENEVAFDAVVIMMGSAPSETAAHLLKTQGADTSQIVTNVFLDAFDRSLDLERAVYDLRPIIDSFAEQSERSFEDALPNMIRETGLQEEQLREATSLDLTLKFELGLFV